jgi:hypothetical protein
MRLFDGFGPLGREGEVGIGNTFCNMLQEIPGRVIGILPQAGLLPKAGPPLLLPIQRRAARFTGAELPGVTGRPQLKAPWRRPRVFS